MAFPNPEDPDEALHIIKICTIVFHVRKIKHLQPNFFLSKTYAGQKVTGYAKVLFDLQEGLQIKVHNQELIFLFFNKKTHVVGTQKNRLTETVLLSTPNRCLNLWIRKYLQF